jgi:hypothetical protein
MLCEKYKEALIEAAVSGDELAPDVSAHVTACTSCASELTQQRSLVAAIDGNVSRQMNAAVPAAMLRRLDARLAQQPQPKRTPRFAQIFAGSLATLLVAATVFIVIARHNMRVDDAKRIGPNQVKNQEVDAMRRVMEPPRTSANASANIQHGAPGHTRSHSARVAETQKPLEAEVLIPPEERVALEHFIAKSKTRDELVAALMPPLRRSLDEPVKHIEIPDINTAGIVIEPIGEETRR